MPVSGGEGLVGNNVRMCVPKPPRYLVRHKIVQRLIGKTGDTDIEQTHIDMLAGAGAPGMHHSGQDGGGGVGAGQNIDQCDADFHRHAVGLAGDTHQAAHALDHEIIAGATGIRPMLSKAGDRAIDQPGIDRCQRVVIEAVFRQPANLEILDHDVAVRDQFAKDRRALRRSDVDGKRSLVAVDGREICRSGGGVARGIAGHRIHKGRSPAARIIAGSGPLDLDNVGAEIAKHLRGPGAGQNPRQIKNPEMRQRPGFPRHGVGLMTMTS